VKEKKVELGILPRPVSFSRKGKALGSIVGKRWWSKKGRLWDARTQKVAYGELAGKTAVRGKRGKGAVWMGGGERGCNAQRTARCEKNWEKADIAVKKNLRGYLGEGAATKRGEKASEKANSYLVLREV